MSNLEDMQNSVNRYFPNNQCMILQIHEWIKYPFKVQDRLNGFYYYEAWKVYWYVFRLYTEPNLSETTCRVQYSNKEDLWKISRSCKNIPLFKPHIYMKPIFFFQNISRLHSETDLWTHLSTIKQILNVHSNKQKKISNKNSMGPQPFEGQEGFDTKIFEILIEEMQVKFR